MSGISERHRRKGAYFGVIGPDVGFGVDDHMVFLLYPRPGAPKHFFALRKGGAERDGAEHLDDIFQPGNGHRVRSHDDIAASTVTEHARKESVEELVRMVGVDIHSGTAGIFQNFLVLKALAVNGFYEQKYKRLSYHAVKDKRRGFPYGAFADIAVILPQRLGFYIRAREIVVYLVPIIDYSLPHLRFSAFSTVSVSIFSILSIHIP